MQAVDRMTSDNRICRHVNSRISRDLLNLRIRITRIREERKKLTTFLTAKPARWSEVAGTYDLDFGKALTPRDTKHRRDLIGEIGTGLDNIGQAVGNGVQEGADAAKQAAENLGDQFANIGDASLDKSATFNVAVGQPNQVTNIVDQPLLKVDCVNCFITGSFQVTGHLSVRLQHSGV